VDFYRDVFGIHLKFESPGWTEFVTDGATLALHKSGGQSPDGDIQQAEQVSKIWDLETGTAPSRFHDRMIENDVRCVQEPTETFDARIAQYVDPDGLVFSVSEPRTPE
jgi:catechol 2,3-dioxygenase-like lactoylglutathione lyase family enzyme